MTDLRAQLSEERLAQWLPEQRWFASKTRDVAEIHLADLLSLCDEPTTAIGLVEVRFQAGTHELYQLLLGVEGKGVALDALTSPAHAAVIARRLREQAVCESDVGSVNFFWELSDVPADPPSVRPLGFEQSNSTIVLDDRYALQAFRRLGPGKNPELEMLRFLSAREFANVATLAGWYELRGDMLSTTLGIAQEFISDGRDGWELALDELGSDPERFLARLQELGGVVGHMHALLG